jgi:hypothetical protein
MNVLLQGIVGSTAYGLAHAGSDIDRLGVYAAPTIAFHGLHLPIDKHASVVTHDPDTTHHEARKYCALALGGNPTVSELMWLDGYEIQTDLGAELVAIRGAFLSAKRVRDAYCGYAASQLHRLVDTGRFQSKMRKRESKHGRHMLRLLDQGLALYRTGQLPVRVDDPQRYIDFGERCAGNPDAARPALAEAEAAFDAARSPLPDQPDEAAVEAWLRRVRAAYWTPDELD